MTIRTAKEIELLSACEYLSLEEVKKLIEEGVNPNFECIGYPLNADGMDNFKTPLGEIMSCINSLDHLLAIELLLDSGADINGYTHHTVNGERSTPLGRALLPGYSALSGSKIHQKIQQKVVKLLLSRGANISLLSEDDLARFMRQANANILQILLEEGMDPNRKIKGELLLEHAIAASNGLKITKLLIDYGADIPERNKDGRPLVQQVLNSQLLELLVEKNDKLLSYLSLHRWNTLGSPKLVQRLIDRGDDINAIDEKGNTPLMVAAKAGEARGISVLLEAKANVNAHNFEGETALHFAMEDDNFHILWELYSRGAIPRLNSQGRTPLMCYPASRHLSNVNIFIQEFSRFEARYYLFDPSKYADDLIRAYKEQQNIFKKVPIQDSLQHLFANQLSRMPLIENPQIEQPTKGLLIALRQNNEIAVGSYLKAFPDLHLNQLRDEYGANPLSIVIKSVMFRSSNCLPMLSLLLDYKADINLADDEQNKSTPLLACFEDLHHINVSALKFLLAHHANPNIGDALQVTPLHKAAGAYRNSNHNYKEAIEILLQWGADADAVSLNGKKPVDEITFAWEENSIPAIFNKYLPNKENRLDVVLQEAMNQASRMVFAAAFKHDFSIILNDEILISLPNLIENIKSRKDLTPFSQSRINLLYALQSAPNLLEKEAFSENQLNEISELVYQLYEADVDFIRAATQASRRYNEVDKLYNAASKIQFWVRNHLKSKKEKEVEEILQNPLQPNR